MKKPKDLNVHDMLKRTIRKIMDDPERRKELEDLLIRAALQYTKGKI